MSATPTISAFLRLVLSQRLLSLSAVLGFLLFAGISQSQEIRTAEQVRQLSPAQAEQHLPVRLKGVVTFNDGSLYSRFVQDETAGIYFQEMPGMPGLRAGQSVEIQGQTGAGEYAPIVIPKSIQVLGEGAMPAPQPVSLEELVSGREDSQFVEVVGTVRAVRFEEESRNFLLELVIGGERFTAYSRQLPVTNTEELVESVVKVRGVCSTLFNRSRQLFGFRLLVPRESDIVVEKRAAENPFDIPTQAISSLLQFTPQGSFGRRVKVAGTVVYQEPGVALFIQDRKEGLYCQTRQRAPVQAGDHVEVLGFPAKGEYTPVLQDSVYRRVGSGTPVQPDTITLDEALAGTYDCRLVRLNARLLEQTQRGREQFMTLQKDDFIFQAFLAQDEGGPGFNAAQLGSEVAVTGICLIERGSSWRAGEGWRAKSFRILLRSPGDIAILRSPSWWTTRRVLWMAGALALLAVAASAWVAVLRRRVQKQTEIIRERLQEEGALKERYRDLFENANDMVFTHDRTGRITAINQTGERLLQRSREHLLSCNLVELMAEDCRAPARQWLEQVVAGAEVPTAEWDFMNSQGHRVKLEISLRLIEQDGRPLEIEGIARDITERRRLEREILDISTREQGRIGHDLHDGVCQQLAAIAYLTDILADRLKEKSAPEYTEADRIGQLINEANAQARSVARGLFPVRLAEHGLALALEELAAGTGQRYPVTCRFMTEVKSLDLDSEAELHLYYIVQEALLNAVKHGKATIVTVTLAMDEDRLKLTVKDNGTGFQMSDKGHRGMGIRIMRYRAKVIGATLELQSQINQGTQITCTFSPSSREGLRNGNNGRTNG